MRTGSWLAWGAWREYEMVDILYVLEGRRLEAKCRDGQCSSSCGGGELQISRAPDGHQSSVLFWRAAQKAGQTTSLRHGLP